MISAALCALDGALAGLSPQQADAFREIRRWRQHQLSDLAESTANVVFLAPTGRAAAVMRAKGCTGATTIDRALYRQPRRRRWCRPDRSGRGQHGFG